MLYEVGTDLVVNLAYIQTIVADAAQGTKYTVHTAGYQFGCSADEYARLLSAWRQFVDSQAPDRAQYPLPAVHVSRLLSRHFAHSIARQLILVGCWFAVAPTSNEQYRIHVRPAHKQQLDDLIGSGG